MIDASIIALLLEIARRVLTNIGFYVELWDFIIISFIFVKDIVFRNASIGKKIMGIAIFNREWKAPGILVMIKRNLLMYTIGYALWWKAVFVDGNKMTVIDWERNTLGTTVIDIKVFKKLKAELEATGGYSDKKMTDLYNAYLRDLYLK